MEIYYLGGGTCCGKSTIADVLCEKHNLRAYKLDDFIFPYMQQLAEAGNAIAIKELAMDNEATWMREPAHQFEEEVALYQAMLPLAMQAAAEEAQQGAVLAEGAGFLPAQMFTEGVAANRYVCLAPTEAFQLEKYSQREWISQYLQDTSDPDKAFANWMARDVLFSNWVLEQAKECGYPLRQVDGSQSIEANIAFVEQAFGLA